MNQNLRGIWDRVSLFRNMSEEEVTSVLQCLGAEEKNYQKDEIIYHMGDQVKRVGLLTGGSVNITRIDVWGNQNILEHMETGDVFAEAYACAPDEAMMVQVTAAAASSVLFLDIGRVLKICTSACRHHSRLLQNLLEVMAAKNVNLTRKITYLTQKTIRERLLAYLSFQSLKSGSHEFVIPFNRQQLAEYLAVDRSALSGELSKMQKEGLITYKKNQFRLHTHRL